MNFDRVVIRKLLSYKEMLSYPHILPAGEIVMINKIPYKVRGTFSLKVGDGKQLLKDLPYLT